MNINSSTKLLLTNESRIELVTRGGSIYFAPVHYRDTKINSIRKWEQAFKIYTATYTRTNHETPAEIWQYVRIIWDYVSTFMILLSGNSRPLNPERSWAKTYTQGWNLAMRNLLVCGYNYTAILAILRDNITTIVIAVGALPKITATSSISVECKPPTCREYGLHKI